MRRLIILSTYLFFSSQVIAQSTVDSLYSIWNDETQNDTVRLNAMNELAYTAAGGSYGSVIRPDSLLVLANEMHALAKDIGSKRYQVDALIQKSRANLFMRNPKEALETAIQASETAELTGYTYGQIRARGLVGVYYRMVSKPIKALDQFNEVKVIAEELQISNFDSSVFGEIKAYPFIEFFGDLHNRFGEIYRELGSYINALEHYEIGLRAHLVDGDKLKVAALTNNIGLVHMNLEEYDMAMKYLEEALLVFEEFGHIEYQGNALGNMANIYMRQESYEKAEELMKRHLQIRQEEGFPVMVARTYIPLANLYLYLKDYEKVLEYATMAEEILAPLGAKYEMTIIKMYQGNVYLEQSNYKKSIELFLESSQLADELNSLNRKANAVDYLYRVYKKAGDEAQALKYHEELLTLNDSLGNNETEKKLLQVEFSKKLLTDSLLQVEEKKLVELAYEKEILEETNTRNIFMASGLILLILSGGLWNRLIFTRKSRKIIEYEKDRSENLLLNILPAEVAEELKENGEAKARDFDMVTIIFTDFKEFTQTSEKLTANELVDELNYCFKGFDGIMEKYGIEKIKTIGDAYMAVGGLHDPANEAAIKTTRAALEMQEFVIARKKNQDSQGSLAFEMRLGMHSGPVVAGIVGVKKFQYDIWGDTVNTASRMESAGQVGRVNISQATYDLIQKETGFSYTKRGKVEVKGKGELDMYFVSS